MIGLQIEPAATKREVNPGIAALRPLATFCIVFLHTDMAWGYHPELFLAHRLRDFGLPFFAMASFFLLASSARHARQIIRQRFLRIEVPLYFWTLIYAAFEVARGGRLSWTMATTGYFHLWFLQYIFIATLVLLPIIRRGTAIQWFAAAAVSFPLVLLIPDRHHLWLVPHVLIAIGMAKNRSRFDPAWLVPAVIGFAALHLWLNGPVTRLAYPVSVFLLTLGLKSASPKWLARLARETYGIYILHLFGVFAMQMLAVRLAWNPSAAAVPAIALCIYFGSYLAVLQMRRIPHAEAVIP